MPSENDEIYISLVKKKKVLLNYLEPKKLVGERDQNVIHLFLRDLSFDPESLDPRAIQLILFAENLVKRLLIDNRVVDDRFFDELQDYGPVRAGLVVQTAEVIVLRGNSSP